MRSMNQCADGYKRNSEEIRALLLVIKRALIRHRKTARQFPRDWGMTGDLSSVIHDLRDVADFICGGNYKRVEDQLNLARRKSTAGAR